jgi:AraC family transcriptional regulator of adaptative response / DNA-3-methyladenine glycosylase II
MNLTHLARAPYDLAGELAFLAARAVPGVEAWDGERYHRALDLPHGHGVAVVDRTGAIELTLEDERDRPAAVRRLRRLFDVDADPGAVADVLVRDPLLAPLVTASPGRRVPGSVDPYETVVRAIVGQQVSVAGARTMTGRIVTAIGERLRVAGTPLTHVFPAPAALAAAGRDVFPMPQRRAATITEVGARVAAGRLTLVADADAADVARQLLEVPGIGPWTAGYVAMRGLGDPDVFLPTDLGVRVGLAALGTGPERAERWRPFRSYALHHLWALAADGRKVA